MTDRKPSRKKVVGKYRTSVEFNHLDSFIDEEPIPMTFSLSKLPETMSAKSDILRMKERSVYMKYQGRIRKYNFNYQNEDGSPSRSIDG